jgi:hypothetical protein
MAEEPIDMGATQVMKRMVRGLVAAGALAALAGCATQFATNYDKGVDPAAAKNWRVAGVYVYVPKNLTVSNKNVLIPHADIVWQEDPPGDRRAQVGKIMKDAITAGAKGLKGRRPVYIYAQVTRFHALTPVAQSLKIGNVGVLDIMFNIEVDDARTGKVLARPEAIDASEPGLTGVEAIFAMEQGNTQKRQIESHVRNVIAGWLGIGPDVRKSFLRIGA